MSGLYAAKGVRTDGMQLSPSLLEAIDHGDLTDAQLRELITAEAAVLGLDYETAVKRARARTLPKTVYGLDLELLVMLLPEGWWIGITATRGDGL
jgi:hypothetical protein